MRPKPLYTFSNKSDPPQDVRMVPGMVRRRTADGVQLLSDRIRTASKGHLKQALGLSVERRADSPGYWKD